MNVVTILKNFFKYLDISTNSRSNFLKMWGGVTSWGTVLAGLLFNRGAISLTLVLIARRSTVAEYGQYASSFALASTLISLTGLGLEPWLLTRVHSTPLEVYSYLSDAMRLRLVSILTWFTCMILLIILLPQETYPGSILIYVSIALAFESLSILTFSAMRRLNRHWQITLIQSISGFVMLLVVATSPVERTTVTWFAGFRAILAAIAAIVTIAQVDIRQLIHPIKHTPYQEVLKNSSSFIWSELSGIIYMKADITIVGLLLGSTLSGLYAAASNVLQITYLVPQALYFSIVPVLSSAYARRISDAYSYKRKASIQLLAQIVSGLLIFFTVLIFAPFIVTILFGQAYVQAIWVVRLLSPIALLRSINFALSAVLVSSQRQAQRAGFQVFSALFNVTANFIVAVPFGLVGVAAVFVISETILAVGYTLILLPGRSAL